VNIEKRALEHIAVADLRPAKRNARTHSKKQSRQIGRSIEKVGFANPLIIDDENSVLAGHGRLAAARELGLAEVPCIRLRDVSEADRRTYAIAMMERVKWRISGPM
jgi:ParB-like chromosome segregation protein Spo0J